MSATGRRGANGAGSLDSDIRTNKFGSILSYLPIDHRNRYAFTRVALRPGLIQVVVREVCLVRRGDRVICLGWSGGERGDASGDDESGSRSPPRAPIPTMCSSRLYHWRGSHPSSFRGAGLKSLSVPITYSKPTSATRHLHEYQGRKIRVPRNTMKPLQAYDHLFTFTSVSETHTVTTDREIWVWAQPIGRAHTNQLRIAPPSASQRLVCCQDLVDFLARGRVSALVEDRDA